MKKIYRFMLLCAIPGMLSLAACTSSPETDTPGGNEGGEKVDIAISTSSTRTSLENDTYVHWSEDDMVWINGGSYPVTVNESDPTSAIVSGVEKSYSYLAAYPADAQLLSDGNKEFLSIFLPNNQPYTPGSFAMNANPMVAYSTSASLAFKNVCGIIRFGITGSVTLASISVSGNNSETLSGYLDISLENIIGGNIETTPSTALPTGKTVTVNCGEGITLDPVTPLYVYAVIPVQTYTQGFTITLTASDGSTCLQSTNKSVRIERSKIREMEPFAFTAAQNISITTDAVTSTSIDYTVSAKASSSIRTMIIAKSMWDHYLNGSFAEIPEELPKAILSQLGTTVSTNAQGTYSVEATQAIHLNGQAGILASTDYKILASYADGESSVGTVTIQDIRTLAPSGEAPMLTVTSVLEAKRPWAIARFQIETTNAANIYCYMLSQTVYDNESGSGLSDAEIIHKYGVALNEEALKAANSGGALRIFTQRKSNTQYVLLVLATGAGGKESISKTLYTTPAYIDPTATWTTVSTDANLLCGFFQIFGIPAFDISGLIVEKMDGKDIFRLTNAFPISLSPYFEAAGITAVSDGPFYFYIDATDPAAVKVETTENPLGLAHRDIGELSVGSGPFVLSPETVGTEYTFGIYDAQAGTIDLKSLILFGSQRPGDNYITAPSFLDLRLAAGNTLTTENFQKDPTPTEW